MSETEKAAALLDVDKLRAAVEIAFESNESKHDLYFFQVLSKNETFREHLAGQDINLEALDKALGKEIEILKRNTLAAQQAKAQKEEEQLVERVTGNGDPQIDLSDLFGPGTPQNGPNMLDTLEIVAAAKTDEHGGINLPIDEVITHIFSSEPGMQFPKSFNVLGVSNKIASSIGQSAEHGHSIGHAAPQRGSWVDKVQNHNADKNLDTATPEIDTKDGPYSSTADKGTTIHYRNGPSSPFNR